MTEKVNTDTGLKYVYGENNKVDVYKTSDNTLVQSYTETKAEADETNYITAKTDIFENNFYYLDFDGIREYYGRYYWSTIIVYNDILSELLDYYCNQVDILFLPLNQIGSYMINGMII